MLPIQSACFHFGTKTTCIINVQKLAAQRNGALQKSIAMETTNGESGATVIQNAPKSTSSQTYTVKYVDYDNLQLEPRISLLQITLIF